MRSEITEGTRTEKFPCLMRNKHNFSIVLFSTSTSGTVVNRGPYEIGEYRRDWNIDDFALFVGKITLEN